MAARPVFGRLSTVRARTTAAACAVVGVALLLGGLLFLGVLRRSLVGDIDDTDRTRAQEVSALLRQGSLPGTLAAPRGDALIQVVDDMGAVVASSANVAAAGPIATFRPVGPGSEVRTIDRLPIADDDRYRVVALRSGRDGAPATIYVASGLGRVDDTVAAVRRILIASLPLMLFVVGVTCWLVVGRSLRSVDAIRREVADIGDGDLGRRVPEPDNDDEIGRLARTMNQMLDRLETSAERQRRFVADASHELQSPLASSLADLEIALAHPEAADWPVTAAGLVEDNHRMTKLVQDLLFLARADDGVPALPSALVDLDDVVLSEVGRVRARTRIEVDVERVAPVEVRGSPDQLGRVVRNLLDNAVRHASTRIDVEVRETPNGATLVVADDGPGVPVADREHVFERFARVDTSRSRGTGGTGLGLAIAREIVETHGGTIELEPAEVGARFVVRLPRPD
jgi:signal transduction histidine kinase